MNRTCCETRGEIRRCGGKACHRSGVHPAPNPSGTRSAVPRSALFGAKVRDNCLAPSGCTSGNERMVHRDEITSRNHDREGLEGELVSPFNSAERGAASRPAKRLRKKAVCVALVSFVLIIMGAWSAPRTRDRSVPPG